MKKKKVLPTEPVFAFLSQARTAQEIRSAFGLRGLDALNRLLTSGRVIWDESSAVYRKR